MASNCREIVRSTPAMAALAMVDASSETTAKKRKVNSTSSQLKFSSSSSSSRPYVEENRLPSCTSPREAPASCCSSNGSSELVKEEVESMDLEEEAGSEVETSTTCYCRRERETTASSEVGEESEVVESTARPMSTEEVESSRELTPEKIPSESELEDFFAVHEKIIQKRFAEKYNYDIGKDKPLEEGRYEWVRLKP